ncbi:MAG TPA: ribosome biogenesis GTP-binding protein YihA/YsxC [Pyrinomonadaceae bacterium]|jgi:GTP-binding protein|nr:ribosome biogenesis GTP-binding protein YihA/YsxC [Pyrinomonadaceae bacterium]
MKISSAEFIKSAFEEEHWPGGELPEVAFLGRSNVGKSSLINSLLGVKGLARTSSTPGRTQALNFFLLNRNFYFVDVPGYGYARVPKAVRQDWGRFVTNYLANRESLVLSIQIVDSRHEPTTLDLQLRDWLVENAKPFLTVATKSDKLSQNELHKNLSRARKVLGADGAGSGGEVVAYSAVTGRGRERVWRAIEEAVVAASQSPS